MVGRRQQQNSRTAECSTARNASTQRTSLKVWHADSKLVLKVLSTLSRSDCTQQELRASYQQHTEQSHTHDVFRRFMHHLLL